jgi:hypothetical protein
MACNKKTLNHFTFYSEHAVVNVVLKGLLLYESNNIEYFIIQNFYASLIDKDYLIKLSKPDATFDILHCMQNCSESSINQW